MKDLCTSTQLSAPCHFERRWKSGALAPRTRAELVGAFSREESAFAFQTDLGGQALTQEHQGRRKQSTCFTAAPRTPRRS
jgi:hypothetical protein